MQKHFWLLMNLKYLFRSSVSRNLPVRLKGDVSPLIVIGKSGLDIFQI